MAPGTVTPVKQFPKPLNGENLENGGDKNLCNNLCDEYTNTWLYQGLKPILLTMKVLGMFHSKQYQDLRDENMCDKTKTALTPNPTSRRRIPTASQIYCFIIMILVIFNALRSLYIFAVEGTFGPALLFNIVSVAWYFMCAANSIAYFRACHESHCLPKLCVSSQAIYEDGKDDPHRVSSCRRKAYAYTVICILLVSFNVAGTGYMLIRTNLFTVFTTPFTNSFEHHHVVVGFYLILQLYLSSLWLFPAALHFLLCLVIHAQFKTFNQHLKKTLKEHSGDGLPSDFERLRHKHNLLCDVVEHADSFLAPYSGAVIVQCLVGICLLLYNLVSYEAVRSEGLVVAVTMFWVVADLITMGFLCLGGALINEEVSSL